MNKIKLPYGISDFKSLREQGYLYVDKTPYIEKLESFNSKYLFFIRPRRFGKSLFLSTLQHYYDRNEKDNFAALFGDLHIGRQPTRLQNSYCVLELDFSGLNTGSRQELLASFNLKLKDSVCAFIDKYAEFFEVPFSLKEELNRRNDAGAILNLIIHELQKTGQKMYLIIDEYDHFANDIIAMGDGQFYKDVVRAAGFVRDFYEAVKIGTKSVIDRIFITGVSPIMLDDLTSGFNISTNLTMNVLVNEMLGFTESEVGVIIEQAGIDMNREALMDDLRKSYNGYLFNEEGRSRVYNPDMILYFFNEWQMRGKYPRKLIDENVKTDYGRIRRLITNESSREMLDEIIHNEQITADIVPKFSFDRMYDEQYFVSLLFYMGLLTIDRAEKTRLLLKIPNFVIKVIFWEHIEQELRREYRIQPNLEEMRKSIEQMAFEGTITPFIQYVSEEVLKPLSNRDLQRFSEKHIKVILFAYLTGSRAYRPCSERETENGYIDIFLEKDPRIPDIQYEWIIELKYLKKSDADKLAETKTEGLAQLKRYAESRGLANRSDVKQALVIFIGKGEAVVVE